MTAEDWKRKSVLKSCAISRTRRWNGSLRIKSSVDFWYRRISRRATVPGRSMTTRCQCRDPSRQGKGIHLWGFLTPPAAGADFLAALAASSSMDVSRRSRGEGEGLKTYASLELFLQSIYERFAVCCVSTGKEVEWARLTFVLAIVVSW